MVYWSENETAQFEIWFFLFRRKSIEKKFSGQTFQSSFQGFLPTERKVVKMCCPREPSFHNNWVRGPSSIWQSPTCRYKWKSSLISPRSSSGIMDKNINKLWNFFVVFNLKISGRMARQGRTKSRVRISPPRAAQTCDWLPALESRKIQILQWINWIKIYYEILGLNLFKSI
jgi:hypothetical protein